ncbi:MAG: hypothetical protein ACI88A_002711 [Paraglaciecola sp.]|jgi:hypothetical protein
MSIRFRWPAQRFEQYFTCSQSRAHFFRQLKSRLQTIQVLLGKSHFFIVTNTFKEEKLRRHPS